MSTPTVPAQARDSKSATDSAIESLATVLTSSVADLPMGDGGDPISFSTIISTGALFCKLFAEMQRQGGQSVTNEDQNFIAEILRHAHDPEQLKQILGSRLEAGTEDVQELVTRSADVKRFLERPFNARAFLQTALREVLPPNPPGRRRMINPEDLPILLERAEKLRLAIIALIQVKQASPTKPTLDAIKFLETDHPEACAYLTKHIAALKAAKEDEKILGKTRTIETAARNIADAIAGAELGLSASYSKQRVEEARREARRAMKRPNSEKINDTFSEKKFSEPQT